MVTTGHLVNTYFGLSTDTKPTKNVHNGSVFIVMDAGKKFLFDGGTNTWHEVSDSESGNEG